MKSYETLQLFTPGPISVPARILAAGARPMLHHRSPEFSTILENVVEKAKWLLGTKEDVLPVHTTGRGAMESTILNLFSPGDAIIAVCNGRFGEMYAEMAEIHGLQVYKVCKDWLRDINVTEIEDAFKAHPEAKAITVCQCDTSTAVLNDLASIARIAKQYEKLILADCISSAGCTPIEFDAWQLDVVVMASQKGLMSPTGLSFVTLSQTAWEAVDTSRFPKFYIQFRDIQKNLKAKRAETPGSTPVSLVASVEEALNMIFGEGKDHVYKRHEKVAKGIRAGLQAMGLALFPENIKQFSPGLTAFLVPDGVSPSAVRTSLKNSFGIVTAEGIGKAYKDRVVRIGHMGNIFPKDAVTLIGCLEASLHELGVAKNLGIGTAACIKAMSV